MSNRRAEDRPVVLGRVDKAHGLRGEVKAASFAESTASFGRLTEVIVRFKDGRSERLGLEAVRNHPKGVILKLAGVDDRTGAEALVGAELTVPRSQLPPPEEGEYYWTDLIGLEVRRDDDRRLGVVKALFETGANDVLVVAGPEGETYVPLVETAVAEIDLDRGLIIVRRLEETPA